MRDISRSIGIGVGCVAFISASWVCGQDWPQWRGPNRDAKVAGFKAPQEWPKELTQQWKVEVGAGDATPALVGDKLYVFARQGADEVTRCLNATDGKEVWKDQYPAVAVPGADRGHAGPRSSPAVADGKVVILGVGGVLSCLDAAKGTVLWRNETYKAVPQFHTGMSPLIVDDLAILQLGGKGAGAIVAFDLASGQERWKTPGDGPGYASPAVLTVEGVKQIATLTDKAVVGIGLADGKLLWQISFEPRGMSYNAATPIVDGQTVIYTGQGRGTAAVKIEKQGDAFVPRELWNNPQTSVQFNTPVLKDGLLFGLSDKGLLFCIDAKTGQTAWTDTTKRGGAFAAIVDAGSVLLALPNTSELIAFKPDAKAYTEVARIKVADTPTYAYPVIAGDKVFVKDQQSLAMLSIK